MKKVCSVLLVTLIVFSTFAVAFNVSPAEANATSPMLGETEADMDWDLKLRLMPEEKPSTRSRLFLEATPHQQIMEARIALYLDPKINLIEGEQTWTGPIDGFETKALIILIDLPSDGSMRSKG